MSMRDAFDGGHAQRAVDAAQALQAGAGAPLALAKASSNLFRDRAAGPRARLDLRGFDHVLGAHAQESWVDVEGMTPYDALVAWCLQRGVMPAVVPQLRSITVGGALAGIGIGATSFRHGLVHHTVRELEVLTPAGELVLCTPDNEHSDLFFGFPNSYGALGYALRVRLAAVPVRPYVHVHHLHLSEGEVFLAAMRAACAGHADFVDGVVFGAREYVLTTGRFVQRAPWRSDYTYEKIYWQSVRDRIEDYLSAADYLWRWDTDWFWCSQQFGGQHRFVRRLLGRKRLNSRTYTKWMRLNARWGVTQRLAAWRGLYRESVIQDVDIPMRNAVEFLGFLQREIGILPIWVCPVRGDPPGQPFALYPLDQAGLYVNFGFWDVLQTPEPHEPAHFNRLVEAEVRRLGGIKSLYSDSFFTPEEFGAAYGGETYRALKQRYDPQGRAPELYEKCVGKG
jgi:FAD/FMN-containing dehydrogenase